VKNPLDRGPDQPSGDPQNERDLLLLRSDPTALVVEYQEIIRTIVSVYVRSGMFRANDFEEVVQSVSEEFLHLLPRIVRQFNGSVLVRTYVSAILRNCCLEIRRQNRFDLRRLVDPIEAPEGPVDRHTRTDAQTYIGMEVKTLGAILAQYGRKRPKLVLLLKVRYRFQVTQEDILAWCPACSKADQKHLLMLLNSGPSRAKDKEILNNLLPLVSKAEGKEQTFEGISRWIQDKVQEIISLLNGSPPVSAHTSETLGLLLSEYFSPFSVLHAYRGQDQMEGTHGRKQEPQPR
jgi:hypothetical protein